MFRAHSYQSPMKDCWLARCGIQPDVYKNVELWDVSGLSKVQFSAKKGNHVTESLPFLQRKIFCRKVWNKSISFLSIFLPIIIIIITFKK